MPNTSLYNRNTRTAIRTNGHASPEFLVPQLWPPHVPVTSAASLKDAADTVIGTWFVPNMYGAVEILEMGYHTSAAGGAVTTYGRAKLTIAGIDILDAEGSVLLTPALGASSDAYSVSKKDLNRTTKETNLQATPDYPYALADEVIQMKVSTQGVGAGAQTVWPYLIVRIHPRNYDLWGSADDGTNT